MKGQSEMDENEHETANETSSRQEVWVTMFWGSVRVSPASGTTFENIVRLLEQAGYETHPSSASLGV